MALGRLKSCSGLKVYLPFLWVDWNPEHFHIWKTEGIHWDTGTCWWWYWCMAQATDQYSVVFMYYITTYFVSTSIQCRCAWTAPTDHSLTCSVHPPPALTSLWRSYFSQEYLWTSDLFPRSRPSLHPLGGLCHGPNAAALLWVSTDSSVGLHFLTPVSFARRTINIKHTCEEYFPQLHVEETSLDILAVGFSLFSHFYLKFQDN